ncbi:MAG: threonine synthase [Chloroflexi bacterium]|nr:MAG: threonine synthase [Chloroflexota bacterium]MBL1194566.1 threonine synthase [Chloroflexota bacterium]NOH11855.1 threonine synthase [Chloroflexota bacterium]
METYTSHFTRLVCPECGNPFDATVLQTFCHDCMSPILAEYDLERLGEKLTPAELRSRPKGLWRWSELLPVQQAQYRLTLGEGDTPLLAAPHLGASIGLKNLYIKDESSNPTATFKARGLVMAVARAVELGVEEFVIPTAGNAGGALAAYAAAAGKASHVYMPQDAPNINQVEVRALGADLQLVEGLITDAGRLAGQARDEHGWFDVSTFKEPYRAEGKKTMGLELAEDFDYELPDVVVYPTGGGTGLVGMWKAFDELEKLGWIGSQRPRMVSVQAAGCAPIVRAFETGAERAEPWEDAHTHASGLRVPVAFADRLILRALRESQGTAVAVRDEDIRAAEAEMAQKTGIFAAPEGAATWAAAKHLFGGGWIDPDARVVLFNTGSGLKYI